MRAIRSFDLREVIGDPLEVLRSSLESRGCEPQTLRNGTREGLRAICPSCGKRNRSKLSVRRGDHAPLVVHCFAGCDWREVLDAVGLPYSVALGEREVEVWRSFTTRNEVALERCEAALEQASDAVRALRRGDRAENPAGALRLAAALLDDEVRARGR